MEPLKFIGSSEDDLAAFPREVKQVAGYQLHRVVVFDMECADMSALLESGDTSPHSKVEPALDNSQT